MTQEKTTTAGERTQGLIKGIDDLFEMMDEGILVRDISRDGEADFYKRNLDFVMRMAKIKQSLDGAKLAKSPTAALELIETINATGGISRALEPVGAPEWIDLALVYIKACEECGVEPKYNSHLNECDKCHTPVEEIIGCPDGAELCHSCFEWTHGVRSLS